MTCSARYIPGQSDQQAFPFDPNPEWPHFYSSGEAIHGYIKRTAEKWNLTRDVQLNTQVVGAYWQEDTGKWKVTVEHAGQRRDEYCDILISSQGNLVYGTLPFLLVVNCQMRAN